MASAISRIYARRVFRGEITLEDVKERAPQMYDDVVQELDKLKMEQSIDNKQTQ